MVFENWQEEYKRKLVTAEEAVKVIKSGDHVKFTIGREAEALGFALAVRKDELRGVQVTIPSPGIDFGWYDAGWEESFEIKASYLFPKGVAREWMDARRGDYIVTSPMAVPFQGEPGVKDIDVLLTELSPPDEHGFCSFGASLWNKKDDVQRAKMVIAEVNARLIRTFGDNFVHVSEIDYFVEHTRTTGWGFQPPAPPPEAKTIAGYVSELVQDGDTIQVGAGNTSEALPTAGAFDGKHGLGMHTEMTARGIVKLIKEGVITGRRKTLHPGKVIATAVGGTREDMAFINNNPMFEVYSVYYVSNPRTISQNDNMVAINQAMAVDLTGQMASESIGPRVWSGSGGQPAFAFGALYSRGGRFVIVLPSTAAGGTVSRIVPYFLPGTIVTVPRTCADLVVTEYGIARLRGKTQRQRALELISVAHPDFRAELKREAEKLFWP